MADEVSVSELKSSIFNAEEESSSESDEDDAPEIIPFTLTVWSERRCFVPFEQCFSEALQLLKRSHFKVELNEIDVLNKQNLSETNLLFLLSDASVPLKDAEQRALVDFVQKGGTLLGDAFYPPSSYSHEEITGVQGIDAKRIRQNVDRVLSLFHLEGVRKRRLDAEVPDERAGFSNRLESRFRVSAEPPQYRIGPWVPLFEERNDNIDEDEDDAESDVKRPRMRTAYLPRGTFGLGQVLLVSNVHCLADKSYGKGGLLSSNESLLINTAKTASRCPPFFPRICRPSIIEAAFKGDLSMVIKYFETIDAFDESDDDLRDEVDDAQWKRYQTAIHSAAAAGKVDVLQYLIEEQHFAVDYQQPDMETPVHAAARGAAKESLDFLVNEKRADMFAPNRRGYLPIHLAARVHYDDKLERSKRIIKWMVKKGVDINIGSTVNGATPFFAAVADSHALMPMIEFLVEEMNANIHQTNKDGWHPLLVAANNHSDPAVVQQLISWGVDPLTTKLEGENQNALHRAILNGRVKTAIYLGTKYPELISERDVNDYSCLHFAARGGYTKLIKWMIDEAPVQPDPKSIDKHGKSSLHVAVIHGRFEACKFILKAFPAMLNMVTKDGWTALTYAARAGHLDIVKLLLEQPDIQVNVRTHTVPHDTALLTSMKHAQWDIATALIECEATDVKLEDEEGWTPLHLAVESKATSGHKCPHHIVEALLDRKADPNATLKTLDAAVGAGWSPMTLAAHRKRDDLLDFFMVKTGKKKKVVRSKSKSKKAKKKEEKEKVNDKEANEAEEEEAVDDDKKKKKKKSFWSFGRKKDK